MTCRSMLAALSGVLCIVAAAYAENEAPVINKFGQVGLLHTTSAKTLGFGRLNLGVGGAISGDDKFVRWVSDTGSYSSFTQLQRDSITAMWAGWRPDVVYSEGWAHLGYGITRYIDFSAYLPIYLDWMKRGPDGSFAGSNGVGGIGDLELALKVQYPPYPHNKIFDMAYYGAVVVPTGWANSDRLFVRKNWYYKSKTREAVTEGTKTSTDTSEFNKYYSSKAIELDMKMLWTLDLSEVKYKIPVRAHLNYGVRWIGNTYYDNVFLLNGGLECFPTDWLTMFVEISGESRFFYVNNGFMVDKDPLRFTPGLTLCPPGGFYLTLAGDINISDKDASRTYIIANEGKMISTKVEPKWKFTGNIGWAGFVIPQDKDKDGIKDNVDRCPDKAEDYDSFQDEDGCPDFDNDNDGVADTTDKCVNQAEDKDSFQDEDGCPDVDNDKDGILDESDKCINDPEDHDGFADDDGCPDFDNDADGVVDSLDKCLNVPEDKDGTQDADGCPDIDNDMDGIVDSLDKCPNEPETFNAFNDEDGCTDVKPAEPAVEIPVEKPKAKEISRGAIVMRGVNFETGKAILTGDSYAILDQVVASLLEWPEIKIEISGHTDNVGAALANKKLSYSRALSVRDYLVSKGVGE